MPRSALAITLLVALSAVVLAPGLAVGDTFVSVTATTAPDQPTTDDEFAVDVTIDRSDADSGLEEIDSVAVYDASSPGDDPIEVERPSTTLAAGESTTVRVDELERDERGVHEFRIETTLSDGNGDERTVVTELPVRVYAPDPLVEVDAAEAVPGAWRPVNVTVANGLDEPISGVSLRVESDAVRFRQRERVAAAVDPQASHEASFSALPESAGVHALHVTVEYEDPDGQVRSVTESRDVDFTGPSNPGRIELTGVTARQRGGAVEISGSAANTGDGAVDSVVVAVGDTTGVAPAQPQPEYFVGSVDASGFSSFTVNAAVDGNRSAIPVEVRYSVDGVQQTATRQVPYEASAGAGDRPPAAAGGGGGGSGLTTIAGFLAVAGLVGGVWYRRRRA